MMRSSRIAVAALLVSFTCSTSSRADDAAASHRPLIAVIGENDGTEVTDFVIPYAVLSASGVADVVDVSVRSGPLHLMPGLTILAKETITSFDAKHPNGADYVVVPAMHHADNPALLAWLRKQAASKATTVGVCDGVWVVGNAGLLENRAATGHWYSRRSLASKFPHTRWTNDRRYVEDGPLITTTGVTASLPVSLALVERMAGREHATELARELGVSSWSADHRSADFLLTPRHAATAALNWLAFWRYERIGVPIATGVDEMSLSFTLDALGRTYRSTAFTLGAGNAIETKRGLTIVPDLPAEATGLDHIQLLPSATTPSALALDRALDAVTGLYGSDTAKLVALQLEYAWHATDRRSESAAPRSYERGYIATE